LDPADDEPQRFFTYFFAALQQAAPGVGEEIAALLAAGQLPPGDIIAATLINGLLPAKHSFLLVLDDLHVIQDRFILQVLQQLVGNLPPELHLVLITREDPDLPLARLRARNQLTEIRAGDLRFTRPETADFFSHVMGLSLSQFDIASLADKTEGWIAGLQLAGLSIRDRADPSGFIAGLRGTHRFILNYLTHQRLSGRHLHARRLRSGLGAHAVRQGLQQGHGLERTCGQWARFSARVRRPGAAVGGHDHALDRRGVLSRLVPVVGARPAQARRRMKALLIYDSRHGNTEKIACAIGGGLAEGLGASGSVRVLPVGEAHADQLAGWDLLIVGAPTHGSHPSPAMKEFLDRVPDKTLAGVNVAAFDTRTDMDTLNGAKHWFGKFLDRLGYAAPKISTSLEAKDGQVVMPPEGFIVKGTEGPLKDGELERATAWGRQIAANP
jgi:flavodoxin